MLNAESLPHFSLVFSCTLALLFTGTWNPGRPGLLRYDSYGGSGAVALGSGLVCAVVTVTHAPGAVIVDAWLCIITYIPVSHSI